MIFKIHDKKFCSSSGVIRIIFTVNFTRRLIDITKDVSKSQKNQLGIEKRRLQAISKSYKKWGCDGYKWLYSGKNGITCKLRIIKPLKIIKNISSSSRHSLCKYNGNIKMIYALIYPLYCKNSLINDIFYYIIVIVPIYLFFS